MLRGFFGLVLTCLVLMALTGCAFNRSSDAANARRKMVGLSKEQVLICMGPPGKKTTVGDTEVWQYSSGGEYNASGAKVKTTSNTWFATATGSKSYCSVNVVMSNDVVSVVHYNGPRGGLLTSDEQCGYAIEHCVE